MAKRKPLTLDQIAARQDKAVAFLRNVVGDADKADEIESLSVEEYADRKGFTIANPAKSKGARAAILNLTPTRRTAMATATKAETEERLDQAEETLDNVWDEVLKTDDIENPTVEQLQDIIDNIADCLNEYDPDEYDVIASQDEEEDEAA